MNTKPLYFNELSLEPQPKDNAYFFHLMQELVDTYEKAKEEKNFRNIRFSENLSQIQIMPNMNLQSWINESKKGGMKSLLVTIFQYPFGEIRKSQGQLKKHNEWVECCGIIHAHNEGTVALGFDSEKIWRNNVKYQIKRKDNTVAQALCLSCSKHLEHLDFQEWYEQQNIELIETRLKPEQKKISLGKHHGKKELKNHAQKLVQSPYVEQVITSLEMDSCQKKYILKTYDKGKIDLRLHWTRRGLGLKIQTTGRNVAETKEIAGIIEKKFGKQNHI